MSLAYEAHERRKKFHNALAARAKPDDGLMSETQIRALKTREAEARRISRQFAEKRKKDDWERLETEWERAFLAVRFTASRWDLFTAIERTVARHYGVTTGKMKSSQRTADVVKPRMVAMYLFNRMTRFSYTQIGQRFSGRDHTTVMHAIRKIRHCMTVDDVMREQVESFVQKLGGDPV